MEELVVRGGGGAAEVLRGAGGLVLRLPSYVAAKTGGAQMNLSDTGQDIWPQTGFGSDGFLLYHLPWLAGIWLEQPASQAGCWKTEIKSTQPYMTVLTRSVLSPK